MAVLSIGFFQFPCLLSGTYKTISQDTPFGRIFWMGAAAVTKQKKLIEEMPPLYYNFTLSGPGVLKILDF